jgi:aminoglycoside phosphotransferase (APT) family kinase protein
MENYLYTAREQFAGTLVALKTPQKKAKGGLYDYEKKWLNAMNNVDPAHFPHVYETFTHHGQPYMTMEFMHGYQSYKSFIVRNPGQISGTVANAIIKQLFSLLKRMHETVRDIRRKKKYYCAHGDLHNGNIMIKVDGDKVDLKIIDPHKSDLSKRADAKADMCWTLRHIMALTLDRSQIAKAGGLNRPLTAVEDLDFQNLKKSHRNVWDLMNYLMSSNEVAIAERERKNAKKKSVKRTLIVKRMSMRFEDCKNLNHFEQEFMRELKKVDRQYNVKNAQLAVDYLTSHVIYNSMSHEGANLAYSLASWAPFKNMDHLVKKTQKT